MAARAYAALRAPAPLNVAVAAMAALTELGRPNEALEIFQERLKGKEFRVASEVFDEFLFDMMVAHFAEFFDLFGDVENFALFDRDIFWAGTFKTTFARSYAIRVL